MPDMLRHTHLSNDIAFLLPCGASCRPSWPFSSSSSPWLRLVCDWLENLSGSNKLGSIRFGNGSIQMIRHVYNIGTRAEEDKYECGTRTRHMEEVTTTSTTVNKLLLLSLGAPCSTRHSTNHSALPVQVVACVQGNDEPICTASASQKQCPRCGKNVVRTTPFTIH